jgi:protoheme IX farnesyltransferase
VKAEAARSAFAKAADGRAGPFGPAASEARRHWALDFVTLTKPRLNVLVLITTLGGLYLAAPEGVPGPLLLHTLVGTTLVAAGAAALNQAWERATDRLMTRTSGRPLAAGRLRVGDGLVFGTGLSAAGLLELALGANLMAAAVAAATLVSYVLIYTPLKRRTSLATVVGAVPGALPPLIGWSAAGGALGSPPPWSLFLIMFLWQLPHFLAIAWMYREDYARAGLPMLPVVDPQGRITSRQALLWTATLIPISGLPFLLRMSGPLYAFSAIALGLGMMALAFRFVLNRSDGNARALFYGSITYLPLLWLMMVVART